MAPDENPWPAHLRMLASNHLRHADVHAFPHTFPALRDRCIALSQFGLDFTDGEELLGYLYERPMGQWGNALLITTHGLIGKGERRFVSCFYPEILRVHVPDWTYPFVRIDLNRGPIVFPKSSATKTALVPFLQAVEAVPPAQRIASPRLPLTSPDDPTGAIALSQMLTAPNAEVLQTLRYLDAMARADPSAQESAHDMVLRLFILDRTMTMGRGMAHDRWLSPLCAPDLARALAAVVGRVTASYPSEAGLIVEFEVGDELSSASIETGQGLGSMVLQSIRRARAVLEPMKGCTGFRLLKVFDEKMTPVEQAAPLFFINVHTRLAPLEAPLATCRAVLGWQLPYETVLGEGARLATQRLRETLGA